MVFVSKVRVAKLDKVLDNYHDIFSEGEIREQLIGAFKSEKPITGIELYDLKTIILEKFIEELEEFFFVGQVYFDLESPQSTFSGVVFVSLFKDTLDVMAYYANKHNGMLDAFVDLSRILFGYSSEEVAQYYSQERLKKFNLIK